MADSLPGRRTQSILVVDDNEVNAALLKEMLTSRGYPAIAVTSAAAAEAEIRREAPDLILLDVVMPGKNRLRIVPRTQGRSEDAPDSNRHDYRPQRAGRPPEGN